MSEFFLTNPDSPPSHLLTKKGNVSFDYKEKVQRALMELGVPLRPAELAVIDLKTYLKYGHAEKMTPKEVADFILCEVRRLYIREDGTWAYTE